MKPRQDHNQNDNNDDPVEGCDREHLTSLLTSEFLTTAQAGRVMRITRERVRQLAVSGELPSIQTPSGRLYSRCDVARLAGKVRHPAYRQLQGEF